MLSMMVFRMNFLVFLKILGSLEIFFTDLKMG